METPNEQNATVAMLGLGIIGEAWARNLTADGVPLRAWNRTPKPNFPGFVPSAAQAVEGANVIFIVVADPPAVESVLDQIESRLSEGQTVVQSSTISAQWSLKFAQRVQAAGAKYLEAPFTGSKPAAQARQTVFYIGGEAQVLEGVRVTLERLSKAILHIGPLGSASTLKLAMNLNIAAVANALCEGLTLCRQSGIADEVFFDALHLNVARSGLADLKEPKLREGDYAPQFSVKHMGKDLRLALETAAQRGLELPQTQTVREVYERGIESAMGNDDFIGLIRLLQSSR
jgi:3-hydroxyisobutyrate dehydrogenase-like beta-hydroxyacid dehydrogenase